MLEELTYNILPDNVEIVNERYRDGCRTRIDWVPKVSHSIFYIICVLRDKARFTCILRHFDYKSTFVLSECS